MTCRTLRQDRVPGVASAVGRRRGKGGVCPSAPGGIPSAATVARISSRPEEVTEGRDRLSGPGSDPGSSYPQGASKAPRGAQGGGPGGAT